jgi:membrane fusion protein (multidrug efflux system)
MSEHKRAVRAALITVAIIGVVAGGLHWWFVGRFVQSTDDAYVKADISVITPRIAGEVRAVRVNDYQNVRRGDVLVEIDRADYTARVVSARAGFDAAEAALNANGEQLKMQGIAIEQADAEADAAKADAWRAESDWNRISKLVSEGVVSHQRSDTAQAAYKAAAATVERAEAGRQAARRQVEALKADRQRLKSEIEARAAALHLAQIDLEATTIVAPVDGTVGDLSVRVGERISPGAHLLSLVPLQSVYVIANFKETQLTHMAVGQPAKILADAFPGTPISGRIDNLSPASGAEFSLLPPQNATGNFTKIVQRVPVRIALSVNNELRYKLRPGMSVVAKVDTHEKPAAVAASAQ